MKLFIEPVDVWLFRNNKPFDAGSDHWATSLFPPSPQVIAGVLRSHHLVVNGIDLRRPDPQTIRALVGTAEHPPQTFSLRGPALARREEIGIVRYYPLPADAIPVERDDGQSYYQAQQPGRYTDGPCVNLPAGLELLWRRPYEQRKVKGAEGGLWLAEADLLAYLQQGRVSSAKVKQGKDFYAVEDRLGIQLDDATRTTETGRMYEIGFIRLEKDTGLMVEVTGLEGLDRWPERGVIGIGGESRAGRFCRLPDDVNVWPAQTPGNLSRFKIYFVTPTCFEQGWKLLDWGEWFKEPPRLVGAALPRPLLLGGYDVVQNQSKPARRYVSAGAVYFFEGNPALKEDVSVISNYGAELGFGQFTIGRW
jgi:CRISPR-associated protein Cmr3